MTNITAKMPIMIDFAPIGGGGVIRSGLGF